MKIGTIISGFKTPSPSTIEFVVNKRVAHKGQYVELEYEEGILLGFVVEVYKTNRYFERAEAVKEFESNGVNLTEQFPTNEWEYLIAEAKPLGVLKDGMIIRATFPPSPGTSVNLASNENLKKFLNFDDNGLKIGELTQHNVTVSLNMSKLLQKHLAILAMSGSGKSFCTAAIIEELLDRQKELGRLALIIFDVHGEYTSFAQPVTNDKYKDYSSKTKVIRSKSIKIGVPKLKSHMFSNLIEDLTPQQRRILSAIHSKLTREMKDGLGPFDLNRIIQELNLMEDTKSTTRESLISKILSINELRIFSSIDSHSVYDLMKPGQLTIIDLSDEINERKKKTIVSYLADKLFWERRQKQIPPFTIILEEAHNFIPSTKDGVISRRIFKTIAREGRKFGASLCLISQRPKHLDTTTLSQCNTNIILRITNPNDLKHIEESAESIDSRSSQMITSLKVGEALLIGEAVNFPTFFKVRMRKSMPSIHETSLEDSAKEFEDKSDKENEETKAFL